MSNINLDDSLKIIKECTLTLNSKDGFDDGKVETLENYFDYITIALVEAKKELGKQIKVKVVVTTN